MKQLYLLGVVVVVLIIFTLPHAQAIGLNYYGIEDTIQDDLTVRHKITLQFDTPLTHLNYKLGFEITNLSIQQNFGQADCTTHSTGSGSDISCNFVGMTSEKNQLILLFNTQDQVKFSQGSYHYQAHYGISLPVEKSFTLIRLPQGGNLLSDVANQSFSPATGKVLTDGKYIMVYWDEDALASGSNLYYQVDFELPVISPTNSLLLLYTITAGVVLVLIGLFIYYRRGREPVIQKSEIITSVLNPDEKVMVDILRTHDGKTGQKILVRESQFSKAKVSRLVKNMKDRNIIDIEPISGRENRIILKTDIIGDKEDKPAE